MEYRYFTCDVFTDTRFGGNPLAVLPDAIGLSAEKMQQIAREFNYSETTFVFPPREGQTRHVRIFTPTVEVPFAGHPNIGTAFTLATIGEIAVGSNVTFEEAAGPVPIRVQRTAQGNIYCELKAPQPVQIGQAFSAETVANILSLDPADIVTTNHPPQVASVGLPFLVVELRNRDALARVSIHLGHLNALAATGATRDIHVYTQDGGDFDLRARMFAPLDNVYEDPATGSANCALAGLLAQLDSTADRTYRWRIGQGIEMGRPSVLEARAKKENGTVTGVWIGGQAVMVRSGLIEVGA